MDIISNDFVAGSHEVDLVTSITRKAWSMLVELGDVGCEEFDLDVTDEHCIEEYETIKTEFFYYGEQGQYRACLDMFPCIDEETCTDVGYVALHLAQVNDLGDVEEHQQLVFRQEIRPEGAAVFIGDYEKQRELSELEELLSVSSFLDSLKALMWRYQIIDATSRINMLPFSDSIRRFNSLLKNSSEDT